MMKFVLISIAVILAGLGIYTYSNQSTEKSNSTSVAISQKKEVVQKVEKPLAVTPEVTKQKSSAKNITVKSPKIVSQEPTQEMANEEEIGKGLTLEGIENADVSDEEKDRMRDDIAYYQSMHSEPSEPLTHQEVIKMIEDDVKNGLIQ